MSGVLSAPRLRQNVSAQFGQSKRVIELADSGEIVIATGGGEDEFV